MSSGKRHASCSVDGVTTLMILKEEKKRVSMLSWDNQTSYSYWMRNFLKLLGLILNAILLMCLTYMTININKELNSKLKHLLTRPRIMIIMIVNTVKHVFTLVGGILNHSYKLKLKNMLPKLSITGKENNSFMKGWCLRL